MQKNGGNAKTRLNSERGGVLKVLLISLLVFLLVVIGGLAGGYFYLKNSVNITIKVRPGEVQLLQEEEVPDVQWKVSINDERYKVLPLRIKNFYTVGDLM